MAESSAARTDNSGGADDQLEADTDETAVPEDWGDSIEGYMIEQGLL